MGCLGEGPYQSDILKELNDGRINEVVALTVGNECLDDRLEKIVSDNVTIVELVLKTHYPSAQP